MHELKIQLPNEVENEEARMFLMMKLFETGKLSLGQPSKYSGFSKRVFMELLGKYGVPVFDYPAEDLEQEMNL